MFSWRFFVHRFRNLTTMVNRQETLLLFDVDGTLTESRKVIEPGMKDFLLNVVKPNFSLGVIGGSDLSKLQEQLGGEDMMHIFDYVFSENGLVAFKNGVRISSQSIQKYFGEEKLQTLINGILRELSEINIPVKRGTFVEFRTGMLNVSPIGRSCSQAERDAFYAYDKEHKVREKLIEKLKKRFPDYDVTYSIGGEISIDIFPRGWDKTYALDFLDWGFIKEVYFFGDRTDPGGNDHEIYSDARVKGHKVTSPLDTKEKLCSIFDL